eukprot:CAMPEP_0119564366 /NCGR_PEP_ID=MMETSP1352-20130426/26758_1 /TAXON_ID=265584 /ORGANISM="Stauroneis constricta, Strain CCMP1120" /LENGTH=253 /DNA_ID=CAMNT_0007613119 /DNA_START=8 /DNA_END=766 /DNA_ORIENTATION=-
MKINANFKAFAGVQFDATKYIESPAYGVNRFMLDRIGNEKARATTIVEYKPNSKFPEHEHIGGEEFIVLEGTFKDQYGEFAEGTYIRNPIGTKHAPWVDDDGCTILVKLLQMAESDEKEPLHVKFGEKFKTGSDDIQQTEYGSVLEMYHNDMTGERVQMCWVDAGKYLSVVDDEAEPKGEELFVFDGSLEMSGDDQGYPKWGWLRFPASKHGDANDTKEAKAALERRKDVKAGKDGATVYRKTGHLTDEAMAM